MNIKPGYTFDDVLLVPRYSEVSTRKDVDLTVDLGKNIFLQIPIVSANMKSITEAEMAKQMIVAGGLALLHRFCKIETQIKFFKEAIESNDYPEDNHSDAKNHVGCSVGVQSEDQINVDKIIEAGCRIVCVDVAHGDHKLSNDMVAWIAKQYPDVLIIAGNIATKSGALRLYNSGANVIKVGVGGGSLCTTRIETGCGVPQLTALEEVYQASLEMISYVSRPLFPSVTHQSTSINVEKPTGRRKFKIIADGGIRHAGDIVKALCFSDAVMLGNLLAGTEETPGMIIQDDFVSNSPRYKEYEGSSTYKSNHVEGIVAQIPYRGLVKPIIDKLLEGVRSGCSYQGVGNLTELKEDPEFVTITNSGLKESHPHALEKR